MAFLMKHVLVISSFVAGSNVGGSLAVKVLPQLGLDVSLLPTTLLGRHPGWGAPGGGAVPIELFSGMANGLVANDIPGRCDAVITGYFASVDQVRLAAELISDHFAGRAPVIVDPIMGDTGKGLYIANEVAQAIVSELLPLADIITPNTFEFHEIERRLGHTIEQAGALPERSEIRGQLTRNPAPYTRYVTSVHDSGHIGIMMARGAGISFSALPFVHSGVPSGTGDLATLLITEAELAGRTGGKELDRVVAGIQRCISFSRGGELNTLNFTPARDVPV